MNKNFKYELSFNLSGRKGWTARKKEFQELKRLLKVVLEESSFPLITEDDVTYTHPTGIKVKQVA
jgi:hypothetical protein